MMSNGDTKMNEELFWKEVLTDIEVGTTAVVITIIPVSYTHLTLPTSDLV